MRTGQITRVVFVLDFNSLEQEQAQNQFSFAVFSLKFCRVAVSSLLENGELPKYCTHFSVLI